VDSCSQQGLSLFELALSLQVCKSSKIFIEGSQVVHSFWLVRKVSYYGFIDLMAVNYCHLGVSFGDLNYFDKLSGLGLACLLIDISCVFEISSQNIVVHEFLN